MNVWKCKLIFPTDTLQQKIEITDLKPFLAGENTSVLIILATTVICIKHLPVYKWKHYYNILLKAKVFNNVLQYTEVIGGHPITLLSHWLIQLHNITSFLSL